MNTDALVFRTTDTPPEDSLLTVDAGLEQHNCAAAPLSEVTQLAAFATKPSQVVDRRKGRKALLLSATLLHAYLQRRSLDSVTAEVAQRADVSSTRVA